MEEMDGSAWVFDSLVGFLHGPIWNITIKTFIEEKSLPFEPTDRGEVMDKPEYKKIHEDYRNLVDVMLGSFMEDIGIAADQFEAACRLSAGNLAGLPAHFHRRLFEQIWAANDYEMFVKMMTHMNVELQLQALELIERQFGTMPNIFSSDTDDLDSTQSEGSEEWLDNDDVMTEIKKLQLEDINTKEVAAITVEPEHVLAEKQSLLTKLQSFKKSEEKVGSIPSTPTVEDKVIEKKVPEPAPKKIEVSEEQMQARQEYLKQQRDKLLAMKKQVRKRRLGALEDEASGGGEASRNVSRPRSAKIAQAALTGAETPSSTPDAMQMRRALASKLRTEVVDGNQ